MIITLASIAKVNNWDKIYKLFSFIFNFCTRIWNRQM